MLRGEGRGKLSASIDGFILYFLSLLSLELLQQEAKPDAWCFAWPRAAAARRSGS